MKWESQDRPRPVTNYPTELELILETTSLLHSWRGVECIIGADLHGHHAWSFNFLHLSGLCIQLTQAKKVEPTLKCPMSLPPHSVRY